MAIIPEFVIDRQGQAVLQEWKELGRERQKEALRAARAGDTTDTERIDGLTRDYAKTIYKARNRFIAYEEALLAGFAAAVLFILWIAGLFNTMTIVIVVLIALILPAIGIFMWTQSFRSIAEDHENRENDRPGDGV